MRLRTTTGAMLMLLVTGCGATIRSSVASNANLDKYKSYSFVAPAQETGQPQTIADQTIRSALQQNLAMKGLHETAGTPDFLVSYHVKQEQKLEATRMGYGFYGGPVDVNQYTQGTLIVDFIDPQTHQVFWRGTATDVVNHPDSPNPAKIEKVVGQIVDKYPATMAAVPRPAM